MPTTVLDVEQHLLLLELEAPFNKRDVQLARRKMAKRWHPDVAPQGRQFEHDRHRHRAHAKDRAKSDPFGPRAPAHSVVRRHARCLTYPEWGVATVAGIY